MNIMMELISLIINDNRLRYCMNSKCFYIMNVYSIWCKINTHELFLYTRTIYGGVIPKSIYNELEFQLTLVPELLVMNWQSPSSPCFYNGYLNNNGVLIRYKRDMMIKMEHVKPYVIDLAYNAIGNEIVFSNIHNYIARITGGNEQFINFIYDLCYLLIFISDHSIALILNVYGTGGSGKSVFSNFLTYLTGFNNVATGDGSVNMNSRFYSSSLASKKLLILSDVAPTIGSKLVSLLKSTTGKDLIQAEVKYKSVKTIATNLIVLCTTNIPLYIQDNSTGVHRRIIYLEMDNKWTGAPIDLISYNNSIWQGVFIDEFPKFIGWLYCNRTKDSVLNRLGNISSSYPSMNSASTNILSDSNPLLAWIKERLTYTYGNEVLLKHLYQEYIIWYRSNGFGSKVPNVNHFGNLFMQNIKTIEIFSTMDVHKKRNNMGNVIVGVKFKNSNRTT